MVMIGQDLLTVKDVFDACVLQQTVHLPTDFDFDAKLQASVDLVDDIFQNNQIVYGINTNFGGLAKGTVSLLHATELQRNLIWGLRAGLGKKLESKYVRAAMLIRANTLCKGVSGIRREILERLILFLNQSVTPEVRELGSLGASGDLVPLSYIAAALIGLDPCVQVQYQNKQQDSLSVLKQLGLEPISLRPKEGLALVNGTSVLSGIAALVARDFQSFLELTLWINAMICQALLASPEPFGAYLNQLKPHPGQLKTAEIMRALLENSQALKHTARNPEDLHQDQYSIRCIPQYFGPLLDGLKVILAQIEVEINSADDNPLADMEQKKYVHGGNFYGQYIGLAMDQLRQHIALCAKQLDVQISLLCTPEFSRGLPPSLSVGNHEILFGLKGLQIAGNSILPRLMQLANPIVQLYPTHAEQFNQNINSQGFNASMLATQAIDLLGYYLSAATLFAVQSVELRSYQLGLSYDASHFLSPHTQKLYSAVYGVLGTKPNPNYPLIYTGNNIAIDSLTDCIVEDFKKPSSQILAVMANNKLLSYPE